jgi:acyl dehydratase
MTAVTARRFPAGVLAAATDAVTQLVDARWLMAYAAGLGETDARFYDTLAPAGPLAHPLFPVCYEWPPLVALREQVVGDELAPLSVHATHDLVVTRMPRAGETVTTTARVVAIERRRSGTLLVARLTTVDGDGRVLTTTDYGSVYRGVETDVVGGSGSPPSPPAPPGGREVRPPASAGSGDAPVEWSEAVHVGAGAAHVYTECARIWNPIHTDAAVARGAGLPAIILHGTATLGLAVSRVVARELDGDASRVRRVSARFTGFVRLPSTLTVRRRSRVGDTIAFDAAGPDGASVLGEGVLTA